MPDDVFTCKSCGNEVPDKRPFCAACRREMERSKKELESLEEREKTKSSIISKLPYAVGFFILFLVVLFALFPKKKDNEGFGDLIIESLPSGAEVISLDNAFSGGKTPLTLKNLPVGVYKFSLIMENCLNESEIIGAEVKKDQISVSKTQMQKFGSICVDSLPQGAEILLDDVKTDEKTPSELTKVSVGGKNITLLFEDGTKRSEKAVVEWGEKTELFVLSDSSFGGVKLNADEGIKVFSDGQLIGITPLPVILLKPGEHTISLVSPAIIPYKTKVSVKGGNVELLKPDLIFLGVLEIKASREAHLFADNEYMGALPLKVYCPIGKKVVIEVVANDGASWKNGFILKEGEYRLITANLPPPPPLSVSEQYYAPPPPPEPFTDFSAFRMNSRFPPSLWQKVDEIKNDIDQDGESELILAFKSKEEIGSNGHKIMLFLVKKHNRDFFDVVPLRNPKLGCIGEGELISLDIIKSDDLGYREIVYSCGNASKGITERGFFVIHKGKAYNPIHTSGN